MNKLVPDCGLMQLLDPLIGPTGGPGGSGEPLENFSREGTRPSLPFMLAIGWVNLLAGRLVR